MLPVNALDDWTFYCLFSKKLIVENYKKIIVMRGENLYLVDPNTDICYTHITPNNGNIFKM